MARVERATSRGNKPYITSKMVTFDEVEANYVKTATLEADYIKAGEITFTDISGGTATLGGAANGNGVLEVKNSSGTTQVKINNTGITLADDTSIVGGSGVLSLITASNIGLAGYTMSYISGVTLMESAVEFAIYIPSNFTVSKAIIVVECLKTKADEEVNGRYLPADAAWDKLCKATSLNLYKWATTRLYMNTGLLDYNQTTSDYTTGTAIPAALNTYTAANYSYVAVTSGDIKTSLDTGFNSFYIKNGNTTATPIDIGDANATSRAVAKAGLIQSAYVKATLFVYGYVK